MPRDSKDASSSVVSTGLDARAGVLVRHRRWLWIGLGALGALALGLAATGDAARNDTQSAPRDVPYLDGKVIRFSPAFAQRNNVRAVAVSSAPLSPIIEVTGTVTFDTRKFAAIGARIPGRIRRVFKVVGDLVKPHEPLAEIESADLSHAEAQVLAARAREAAAEANMRRERRLADAKISSERESELADANYQAARAERIAAERTVQALGGDLVGELGVFMLKSPIEGKIIAANVARGQTVDSTTTLYQIADLSSLWVELKVFERDIGAIQTGDEVELRIPGAGARTVMGTVDHVGDVIDTQDRTASVRVVVANADGILRPGQSVAARIETKHEAGEVLTIPRAAVTRIDGTPTALVLIDDTTVEPRTIKVGAEDANDVAVLEGLHPGERVVTEGLFALRSEIFR